MAEDVEDPVDTSGAPAKTGKSHRFYTVYKPEWEKLPLCKGWLSASLDRDPAKARCTLCRTEVRSNMGDINRHAKSAKHKHIAKVTSGGRLEVEGYNVGQKYSRTVNGYDEAWEEEPECEGWLSRSKYGARCDACNCEVMPKLEELQKHGRTQRHLRNMTVLWARQKGPSDIDSESSGTADVVIKGEAMEEPVEIAKAPAVMPKRRKPVKADWSKFPSKYRSKWEEMPECKGWLGRAADGNPAKARCNLCRTEIRAKLGDIIRHAQSEKHKNGAKYASGSPLKVKGYVAGPQYVRATNVYRVEWEDDPECRDWIAKSKHGAMCKVCRCELIPKLYELRRHSKAKKHLRNMKLWIPESESSDEDALDAPVVHEVSSGDDRTSPVVTVTQGRYRDGQQAPDCSWHLSDMGRSEYKTASLVSDLDLNFQKAQELFRVLENSGRPGLKPEATFSQVLAPHYKAKLKEDLQDAPFSLVLDDAGSLTPDGEVLAAVYYFSRSQGCAATAYLGPLKVDPDDVSVLVGSVHELLSKWNLEGHNVVAILTGGLAQVCPDTNALVTLLTPSCPDVLHMHSSFLSLSSTVHTAVKKTLPDTVEFVLRESHNWFADSGKRQHRHKDMVERAGFSSQKDLARVDPDPRQWLRVAEYAGGLYDNYDALRVLFEEEAGDCYAAKLLGREMRDERNMLHVAVLAPILDTVSDIKEQAAAEEEEAEAVVDDKGENMCEQVEALFLSLADQVIKPAALKDKTVGEICELDLTSATLLPVERVGFGRDFARVADRSALSSAETEEVKETAASFLRELFRGLQDMFRNIMLFKRSWDHFKMPNFLEVELEERHILAPFFEQDEKTAQQVLGKYRLMKMLEWRSRNSTAAFWNDVHGFGDAGGNFPLRTISDAVFKMMSVPLFDEKITRMLEKVATLRKKLMTDRGLDRDAAEDILIAKSVLQAGK